MENAGRVFVSLTFLTGLLLAGLLYMATESFTFPASAQAAGLSSKANEAQNESSETESNKKDLINTAQSDPSCEVSQKYAQKILRWCDLITQYSKKHGLEPDLLAAVILQESGGDPQAYSHSGAVGLMQVMPRDGIAAEFICKNGPCFSNRPTIAQLEDPEFNIAYGSKMLAGLKNKHGSLREALKFYGPMDAGYSYSDKVLGIYKRFQQN